MTKENIQKANQHRYSLVFITRIHLNAESLRLNVKQHNLEELYMTDCMVHTYCMTADMLSKNVTKGNAGVRKRQLVCAALNWSNKNKYNR